MGSRTVTAALALVAAAALAPGALAAAPVSPAAGAVVSPTPEFVAAVGAGEQPVQMRVSATLGGPDVATCFPSLAGNRASCGLAAPLRDGTYYWRMLYQSTTHCVAVGTQRVCLPEPHLTAATRFTVRRAAPPPPPTLPPTQPPPPSQPPAGTPHGTAVLRPTDGGAFGYSAPEQVYASNGAVVHYVTSGLDAPPLNDDDQNGVPDYVQLIGSAADAALAYYAQQGFGTVRADTGGPDPRPDIYVKHFRNPDLYGLAVKPPSTPAGSFVLVSSRLDASPKLARGSVGATVAHELFHVVQFGYLPKGTLPEWIAEGSATAMSLLVYPNIEDLTNRDYFDYWLRQPWRPLYDEHSYCDHCYGGGLWWDFLAGTDKGLLPDYFRRLGRAGSFGLGISTLDETMRARHEGSLASAFSYFSVALYRAKLRPATSYALHVAHVVRRTATLGGLAAHYVPITVRPNATRLSVRVSTRSPQRPRVVLVVGGPTGRVVLGGSTRLRNRAERTHVLAVITSSGPQAITYRIDAHA